MNEIQASFSNYNHLNKQDAVQQKAKELQQLLDSLSTLNEKSNSLGKNQMLTDIHQLSSSVDTLFKSSTYSHENFVTLSQHVIDFFSKYEHELLFEKFEDLIDFSKKRKKKPSIQDYLTANLQYAGSWTLKATGTPAKQAPSKMDSSNSLLNEKHKPRQFSKLLDQDQQDHDSPRDLTYFPAEYIPRLPQNNLGEIVAFTLAQDIYFESFSSMPTGKSPTHNPDISAQLPSLLISDLSTDEIYESILAILNKGSLTEDDIYKLLQLLSEGGLQLISMLSPPEIQHIINEIEESIEQLITNSTSLENILVLIAHVQQFSTSPLGQLTDLSLPDDMMDSVSDSSSAPFPITPISIEPLYSDNNVDTEPPQPNSFISDVNKPNSIDEQVAGATAIAAKKQFVSETTNAHSEPLVDIEKRNLLNSLGSSLSRFLESKQEQFADHLLELLIDTMSDKLSDLLNDSLQ